MSTNQSFWERIGVQNWLLKKEEEVAGNPGISPDLIYKYIIERFEESIRTLSFANRVIFYHEYIICFSPTDYNRLMDSQRGLFGLIIKDAVKSFYEKLAAYKQAGKNVTPSGNKWVFRFVSHPGYQPGDKGFIGKLLPGNNKQQPQEENLRLTFIPRQTGIAQTFDIREEILKDFTFYSDGYYELPYSNDFNTDSIVEVSAPRHLGRLETTLPDKQYAGKKLEYMMTADEITVTGADDTGNAENTFRVPSEWVSSPHLSIRHDKSNGNFYLASFGDKTILNEVEVKMSEPASPVWSELPVNSRIVLNGIVSINFFKN